MVLGSFVLGVFVTYGGLLSCRDLTVLTTVAVGKDGLRGVETVSWRQVWRGAAVRDRGVITANHGLDMIIRITSILTIRMRDFCNLFI